MNSQPEPKSNTLDTNTLGWCQAIHVVTVHGHDDRVSHLLVPLLHWLVFSREVIFTVRGSRMACVTHRDVPYVIFSHSMYASP